MSEKYIRKQDAVHTILGQPPDAHYPAWYAAQIASLEPADVTPVVRCDDCVYYGSRRWCELHSSVFDDNAFCSYGERREEEA